MRESTAKEVDSKLKPALAAVDNKVGEVRDELGDIERAIGDIEESATIAVERGIAANSKEAEELKIKTDQIIAESQMLHGRIDELSLTHEALTTTIEGLRSDLIESQAQVASNSKKAAKEYELRYAAEEKNRTLSEKLASSKKWSFWLGVGGIVVAAVLGLLLYLTNRRTPI